MGKSASTSSVQRNQNRTAKRKQDSHGGHQGHDMLQMDTMTHRKLVIETAPSQPQAVTYTNLVLQIKDDDDTPVKRFDVLREKLVRLILVRKGLDEFAHLHPTVDASELITGEFEFPKAGKYRLFADHQPQDKSPAVAVGELTVVGDYTPAAPLLPNTSKDVTVEMIKAHIEVLPGEQETKVRFKFVTAAGQPIGDLQPYLGAMGHLVIISADSREYVHAHPLSEAKSAPDGTVEFAAHFPKSGIYKAWGQFQRNGSVFTFPYVVEHKPAKAKPHSGRH